MTHGDDTRERSWGWKTVPWVLLVAFVLCAVAWIASLGHGSVPSRGWMGGLALVLAVAATVTGLARNLPIQNSVMAAVFVAMISGMVQLWGLKTRLIFLNVFHSKNLGPQMFHRLPWALPFLWVVIILNSREVARLILKSGSKLTNPGLWTLGLSCVLALVIDVSLEPFAMEVGRLWDWRMLHQAAGWYGEAWLNLPDCLVMVFLVLALTTPWLINKKPVKHQAPDYYPLTLWLTVNLLLVAANAWHGLGQAAVVGLVAGSLVTILAIIGGRSRPDQA